MLAAVRQALANLAGGLDTRAEKQLVALLSIPLDTYNVVTVLGLSNYPSVMGLLTPATQKVGCGKACCVQRSPCVL